MAAAIGGSPASGRSRIDSTFLFLLGLPTAPTEVFPTVIVLKIDKLFII
jgi:hypothetical protein